MNFDKLVEEIKNKKTIEESEKKLLEIIKKLKEAHDKTSNSKLKSYIDNSDIKYEG